MRFLLLLLLCCHIGALQAQSDLQMFHERFYQNTQSLRSAYYSVSSDYKGFSEPDTAHFTGKVYYFKAHEKASGNLPALVLLQSDNAPVFAFDGQYTYTVNGAQKSVLRTLSQHQDSIRFLQTTPLYQSLLYGPVLYRNTPEYQPEMYQHHHLDTIKNDIFLVYRASLPVKSLLPGLTPDSVFVAAGTQHYANTLYPKERLELTVFGDKTMFSKQRFSSLQALPEQRRFEDVFPLDSLLKNGFELIEDVPAPKTLISTTDQMPYLHMNDPKFNTPQPRLVLLDFWFMACKPCKSAIPYLNRLQKKYGEKGLLVLGINRDKNREQVLSFMENNGMAYKTLFEADEAITGKVNVRSFPTLIVFDPQSRNVLAVKKGFSEQHFQELERLIRKRLKG